MTFSDFHSTEGAQMTIAAFVKLSLATLVAFLAIDMVWLGGAARGFRQRLLGDGCHGDKLERRSGRVSVEAPHGQRSRSSCRVGRGYETLSPSRNECG